MMHRWARALHWALLAMALLAPVLVLTPSATAQYQQPTPGEEEVGPKPTPSYPEPRGQAERIIDVVAFAGALVLAGWVILRLRSRAWLVVLLIAAFLYFGVWRGGCVCPIGGIQNAMLSLCDRTYTISIVVTLIVLLPIVAALFYGRIFCGGVCPFGAVQDLLARVNLRVPLWLDKPLRLLRWVYLAAVIYFLVGGLAVAGLNLKVAPRFLICLYDPFVGLFRLVNARALLAGDMDHVWALTGPAWMWAVTGGTLLLCVFVGRPYCRWVCPYGAILGVCARTAKRGVTVMPEDCCDCELCDDACPFGAIENHQAVQSVCLACTRCYRACPMERHRLGLPVAEAVEVPADAPPVEQAVARGPTAIKRVRISPEEEAETIDLAWLDELADRLGRSGDSALPLLQAVQARLRYVPAPAVRRVAELTGQSQAELLAVSTFYNQFRHAPVGEHLVRVCHGTACHVAGARRITDAIRLHLDIAEDADTDAARRFTVQEIACLGCCSLAPVMQIDGQTFGHLTPETACRAVDTAAEGGLKPAGDPGKPGSAAAHMAGGCGCSPAHLDREEDV